MDAEQRTRQMEEVAEGLKSMGEVLDTAKRHLATVRQNVDWLEKKAAYLEALARRAMEGKPGGGGRL